MVHLTIHVKIPIHTLFLLFFRVLVIGPVAITVVPANLDSQTKDIGVCVRLDLCLHTAKRVRRGVGGGFSQSSSSYFLEIQHVLCGNSSKY